MTRLERTWWRPRVAAVACLLAGQIEAQNSPPADIVPMFEFAIDAAAVAAGLRPLRAAPLPPGEREVRIWTGFGLGIPHRLYHLRTSDGNVRGAIVLWWDHDGEWGPADNPVSMHAYVKRVFGCGRIRREKMVDACEANLGRHDGRT
jgi:hypothetical protein